MLRLDGDTIATKVTEAYGICHSLAAAGGTLRNGNTSRPMSALSSHKDFTKVNATGSVRDRHPRLTFETCLNRSGDRSHFTTLPARGSAGRNAKRQWGAELLRMLATALLLTLVFKSQPWTSVAAGQEAAPADESGRAAYLIEVPLPLMGTRDEAIQQQINQVANKARGSEQRPIVILHFKAHASTERNAQDNNGSPSRGSQFERALSLARYLTSSAASKVRLVAYLTDRIEGHAVLPILACEEIIASPTAELGSAAADETAVDDTVRGAYKDIARRRATLSEAAVAAMIDPNVEVIRAELDNGDSRIVTNAEAKELRDSRKVISVTTIWSGGGLARFTGSQMGQLRWVSHVVENEDALATALNITGRLQTVRTQPEEWIAARVEIDKNLDAARVNQLIRSIGERKEKAHINLLILQVNDVEAEFQEALRLSLFITQLDADGIHTAAIIEQTCASPALLPAFACDQVFVLQSAALGSAARKPGAVRRLSAGSQDSLLELEKQTGRPAGLMTATFDPECTVKLFVNQDTGKQLPLADWQVDLLDDKAKWVPREALTSGAEIEKGVALRYGLIDAEVQDHAAALHELGLAEDPSTVEGPWLETMIQRILAREWLPRLLVVLGFMALMIEMGSPGLGVGGFVAALCFLAFFWIEGLNGNVAWLELILFVAGMVSLAIEFFVVPGFGLFGIGGLLMVLGSIVLASQTFVFPSNSEQLTIIANNLFWVAICALIVMIGAVSMGKRLENTPVLRWVTIEPAGTDDVADLEEREAIVHWEHLLGQDGMTTTRLNPSGKAQFGRMIINVLGTNLISEGVRVRVVEVRGNSVFVEPLE